MITFTQGQESHTSNWGKFYVKGLEAFQVKEDGDYDKHHSYTEYAANVPDGTVFTIFEQSGDKRGTKVFWFTICIASSHECKYEYESDYGSGHLEGNYAVIAQAEGKVKAPRLMDWWTKKPANVNPEVWARHCHAHINTRGLKDIPRLIAA